MVRGKETAEERLLRMIEGPQPAAPVGGRGGLGAPWPSGSRGIRNFLADLMARVRGGRRVRREDTVLQNLRLISRVVWLVLAVLATYVIINLVFTDVETGQPHVPAATGEPTHGISAAPAASLNQLNQPLSEYVSSVMQRNPFTGMSEIVAEAPKPTTESAKARLEAIAAKLVIVGIDRGPSPEALIEDTTQQRTHFVKVGDAINGLRVEEIGPNGVRVSYEGEELLLR